MDETESRANSWDERASITSWQVGRTIGERWNVFDTPRTFSEFNEIREKEAGAIVNFLVNFLARSVQVESIAFKWRINVGLLTQPNLINYGKTWIHSEAVSSSFVNPVWHLFIFLLFKNENKNSTIIAWKKKVRTLLKEKKRHLALEYSIIA